MNELRFRAQTHALSLETIDLTTFPLKLLNQISSHVLTIRIEASDTSNPDSFENTEGR